MICKDRLKMDCFLSFAFGVMCLCTVTANTPPSGPGSLVITPMEEIDRTEFAAFCELGFMIRENPEELEGTEECAVTMPNEFDKDEDLPILFTLVMICTWGAFLRALMRHFRISIPYTVVLLISGLILGSLGHIQHICLKIHNYTAIARISPQHILYTFLPILIFESAFSIPVHVFWRSIAQILLIAFPGMAMATFGTATVCWMFFSAYEWTFLESCLFGCIVSATDPVAVVSILRELGVSEQLSVLIDGESLLNDGVAILLFEIFHEFVVHTGGSMSINDTILHVFVKFCWITFGGPAVGWVFGRIVIFLLGFVYNDPAVEISATICAAYLTYWTSEYLLKVSGVMALVALGITMSAERTVISPESEGPVHHFWEMLGYLANTVLFFLVGIVISETAITEIEKEDFPYLFLLYVALHVIRLAMLLLFYPILKRLGYGLEWENMIIIMWGGLRGAVGICLALQIYEDSDLCAKRKIGPKVLFHTAGIVLLTLCINGTTTKGLLKTLRLTEVTTGQKEEMNNAVKRTLDVRWRMTRSMQMKYMIDAKWDVVDSLCKVNNPYALPQKEDPTKVVGPTTLHPPRPIKDNTTVCWHCSNIVENEPTVMEYRETTNDARLRVIKAMKVDYLHQFEKGTLTEQAVQVLLADAENAEDKYLSIIHAHNFHKHMKIHGFYPWIRDKLIVRFRLHKEEAAPVQPAAKWRKVFFWLVTRDWFDALCIFVVLFNMVPVIWDVILSYASQYPNQCDWTPAEWRSRKAFHITNYIFSVFYTIEVIVKVLGYEFKYYIRNPWNYLDIFVLIVAYVDVYLGELANDTVGCTNVLIQNKFKEYFTLLKAVKLIRIVRAARLLKPLVPKILRRIKQATNFQVFIGYDIGKGFVQSSDDVIKFIPQIVENKKVQHVIRHGMERERNCCVKDLAVVQSKFPGIAVALKTRHACRAVLNQMTFALTEVRDDGLLDDNEVLLLKHILEGKMKRLTHSPTFITPTKPLTMDHDLAPETGSKSSVFNNIEIPNNAQNTVS